MSRTGVGCRVMIDDREVDDGCIDWAAPPPDALGEGLYAADGLRVTWGRSTSIDQPAPSTCTFRLIDDPGGPSYISAIRVGSLIGVYADADISGDASLPAFDDGNFDTGVNGFATNAALTRSDRRASSGTWAASIVGTDPTRVWSATFAPAELQPPGTNPIAWELVPTVQGGETWRIEFDLYLPPLVTARVRPVLFSAPYQASAQTVTGTVLATVTATVNGGWTHVAVDWSPGVNEPLWVGFNVEASGGIDWQSVPDPATWADYPTDPDWTYADYSAVFVDAVTILAPPSAGATTILVFEGRVTDLEAVYDDDVDAPSIDVTAADFLADLGNRAVGATPWAAEPLVNRVLRIAAEATAPGEQPIVVDVAPTVASTIVSYHDVDRQAAAGLLTDLSQSVDGVLWSATHIVTGPYLRLEDPAARPSMYRLELQGDVIVIVPVDFSEADPDRAPLELSACDMLRDPVTFTNDVTDIATRSTVEWLEQTVEDGVPSPTSRRATVTIPDRETAFGTRSISVSTLLTTSAEAVETAERILARQAGDWRVSGISADDAEFVTPDRTAAVALLRLLNGVQRGGLPLQLVDMPSWNPIGNPLPAYVEGGTYTFTGGGWRLALVVSRATGLGQSATWDDMPNDPAWHWDAVAPSITWNDLRGVAGPP